MRLRLRHREAPPDPREPGRYRQLAAQLRQRTERARRARREIALLLPLIAAIVFAYSNRERLFGLDLPVRIAAVIALVIVGWAFARALGRAFMPALFRRLDAGTAGTVGFLVRLVVLGLMVLVALRFAGLQPRTLVVGGTIAGVVFGLAAQQTLGNLIAGTVLLSARPFRVGERLRLQSGMLAGVTEGVVVSLGLLYTTLTNGEDRIMVPNNIVLSSAIVPLREPSPLDVRVRLSAGMRPTHVQQVLDAAVTVPTREGIEIALDEIDGARVLVRVTATPAAADDGARLADQVLAALSEVTDPVGRPAAAES